MTPGHPKLIGQTIRTRAAVAALRLLAWSNGLEAAMSVIATAFAVGTLIYPAQFFGFRYPLAVQLSLVLVPTSLLATLALNLRWRWLRIATSITAFMVWGLLAFGSLAAFADVGQRHGLMFAVFSAIELSIFVRLHLHMEELRDTLDAGVVANNVAHEITGHGIKPGGNGDVGATEKRN